MKYQPEEFVRRILRNAAWMQKDVSGAIRRGDDEGTVNHAKQVDEQLRGIIQDALNAEEEEGDDII
ncbi:MAG: hypothetical protein AAB538_04370 [Patescibacteria group bacterium]